MINEEMKIAAAHAIAEYVKDPTPDQILPDPLDRGVAQAVAVAVAEMARRCGCVRREVNSQILNTPFFIITSIPHE